jgi:hypothetical protein
MGLTEMADPIKRAARQERYRLNLIAARKLVPELKAEIARLKEKLAKRRQGVGKSRRATPARQGAANGAQSRSGESELTDDQRIRSEGRR